VKEKVFAKARVYMEDGKMEMRKAGLIVGGLLFCITPIAFASLKYVDSVDLDLGECYFFDNAAQQFVLTTPTGSSEVPVDIGSLHIAGGGWDYSFVGKIMITPSNLFWKNSSGNVAEAWFTNSSATMTIIASTLVDNLTSEELFNPTTNPGGVVLLTALMNDSDGYWQVKESGSYTDHLFGDTHYAITGGELYNGSLLRMLDFRAIWDLDSCSPANISRFNQNLYSGTPSLELLPDAIPEPATLLLFAAGGLLFRKK